MPDEKQINDWRKHRRQSLRFLPLNAGALIALCVLLALLTWGWPVPLWLACVLIGALAIVVIGDAVNVIVLGRKLRQDEPARRAAP